MALALLSTATQATATIASWYWNETTSHSVVASAMANSGLDWSWMNATCHWIGTLYYASHPNLMMDTTMGVLSNVTTATDATTTTTTMTSSTLFPTLLTAVLTEHAPWLPVLVQSLTTLLSICLFVLALSLYDFCKQGGVHHYHHYHHHHHYYYTSPSHGHAFGQDDAAAAGTTSSTSPPPLIQACEYQDKLQPTTLVVKPQHLLPASSSTTTSDAKQSPQKNEITWKRRRTLPKELQERLSLEHQTTTGPTSTTASTTEPSHNHKSGKETAGDSDSNKEEEEDDLLLCLPAGHCVLATCIICLSAYQVGEKVSWSSNLTNFGSTTTTTGSSSTITNDTRTHKPQNPPCTHAFHTECLVLYAEKTQQHEPLPSPSPTTTDESTTTGPDIVLTIKCPLCRGPFLS